MDRSIYCAQLDFLFNEAPSLLGERSTLSSVTSALERGNASSGLYEEPLARLDSHAYHRWSDQMELERTTRARFNLLNGLSVRTEAMPDDYEANWAVLQERVVSGTATDDDLVTLKAEKTLWVNAQALLAAQYSTAGRRVQHLEAIFGEVVGAVVFLAQGRDIMKMNKKDVDKLERHATHAVRAAHKAWRQTRPKKEDQDAPRNYAVPEAPLSHSA